MKLEFEESQTPFESASQNARIWTEQWVHAQLYCPNCGAATVSKYGANRPVADFFCPACGEDYELKSQKHRFGPRVADGAFATMCARLAARNNPSLILMNYDLARFGVTNLFFVPKHFFVRDLIEERKPLAPTARRAGWIGCNIRLDKIPEAGRVFVVLNGETLPKRVVLEQWRRTTFLNGQGPEARGWLIEIMKAVELIGRDTFTLDDVYFHESRLKILFPKNNNVRPKIRQQLQVLRDNGYLVFLGQGRYRLQPPV